MDGFKQECKLCGNIIRDANYKAIEDVINIKNIFDIKLLKLMLDNDSQSVICTTCSPKLLAALNFKSTCLSRDNSIIPYVDFENPILVDLKDFYAKETGSNQGSVMLDNREICRLCLQSKGGDHKSIQEVPVEIIQIYIPEINFAVSTNPVICLKCHDALCVHGTFIRNCLGVEKQRNMNATDVGSMILASPCIKMEEIEIKDENEENDEGNTPDTKETKILYDLEDLKDANAESTVVSYKIKECTSKTPCESNGKFNTKHRIKNLKHRLLYKDPLEVPIYECDECDYKSFRKHCLKLHQLKHKNPSEVPVFKCDECDYKSIQRWNLKQHQLRHKDSS